MKKKVTVFLAFLFLFSFSFQVALYGFVCVDNTIKLDQYPYRLSEETYISIQYESNPIEEPNAKRLQEKFSSLNTQLKDIPHTHYYECYTQPLFHKEEQINSMQMGLNLQDDMALQVQSGRRFDSSDYIFESGKPIPVILGSKFQNDFKIDDQFQAEYLFIPYTFQVIGFLEPESTITLINQYVLDDYMIMPSGQFMEQPETEEQTYSWLIHNANRVSGILKVQGDDAVEAYREMIKRLDHADAGEFSYYSNSGKLDYLMWGIDIQKFKTMCSVGIIVFLIGTGILLYLVKNRPISLLQAGKKTFIGIAVIELLISAAGALYFVLRTLYLDFISSTVILPPMMLFAFAYLIILFYITRKFTGHQST